MSIPGKEARPVTTLEKRVRTLEMLSRQMGGKRRSRLSAEQMGNGRASGLDQLGDLTRESELIQERAEATGDHRAALLCIRVRCHIIELTAKLRGELDDRSQTNVLNVQVDSDTAKRIAETYLARLRKPEAK
jgi:hypothetical protein